MAQLNHSDILKTRSIRIKSLNSDKSKTITSKFSKNNDKQIKKSSQSIKYHNKKNPFKQNLKILYHRKALCRDKLKIPQQQQRYFYNVQKDLKQQRPFFQTKKQQEQNQNQNDFVKQIKIKLRKLSLTYKKSLQQSRDLLKNKQNKFNRQNKQLEQNKQFKDQYNNQACPLKFQSIKSIQSNPCQKQYEINTINSNQYQAIMLKKRNNLFLLKRQFNIKILPKKKLTVEYQMQTIQFKKQGRYVIQYQKYLELKNKMFVDMQKKYQTFQKLMNETQSFKIRHKQLIDYINLPPQNNRQQRVFALSNNLQRKHLTFKKEIQKFITQKTRLQIIFSQKFKNSCRNQLILKQSIYNQYKILLEFFNNPQNNIDPKYGHIIDKIINQFKQYNQISFDLIKNTQKIFTQNSFQLQKILTSHHELSEMLLQNRVLVMNFVRQIQGIPHMTTQLFGSKQNQFFYGYKQQHISHQEKAKKFMSIECQKCYDYQQKIKYVEFKNHQIKPILKALEWLLRDGSKKITPFAII